MKDEGIIDIAICVLMFVWILMIFDALGRL